MSAGPAALDELRTGVFRARPDGVLEGMNPAARSLLFLPETEHLAGRARLENLPKALTEWISRVAGNQQPLLIAEFALDRPGGDPTVVDVALRPVSETVLVELTPVAERVRQRELADRADRQQTLARMLKTLAHELRNPLGGVRGAAQLIEQQASQKSLRRHAGLIQREVQRITSLIDRFAEGSESVFEPVNIHRVLEEARALVLAEFRQQALVERDFDPSIPEVPGVGEQLHRLALNLLRNALQAGATRLRLVTRIEPTAPVLDAPGHPALRVDFEDNGPGVPEALRQRLFLPMVTGRESGSGFGLALAQQTARAHGGLIEYTPLEPGSRFRLRLPLAGRDDPGGGR